MKTNSLSASLMALALAATAVVVPPAAMAEGPTPALPAQCRAHGRSLGEWLVNYWQWALGSAANGGRGLAFLPLPAGEHISGDFTLDDPGVLEGSLEVMLKPGQSFMLPIAVWLGEIYGDGFVDDPVPDSSMNLTEFLVTIDGKTVARKEAGIASPFYVQPTDFPEPVLYDEPTGYGAIGTAYVQGFSMVHGPLTPGRHILKLHATLFAENYNLGAIYENTWTINVSR